MTFDISAHIDEWRKHLLDTTKRNRLINFKSGRIGGIALVRPDPGDLWHFLVSENQPLAFPWKRTLVDLPEGSDEGQPGDEDAARELAEKELLARCLTSERLRPGHLLTELSDKRLAARLNRLALQSRESLSEQGVTTLHVAFGFLRWFDSADSGVEVRSPLLLVPVKLDRDSIEAPWQLQAEEDEVLFNHTLAQLLRDSFKIELPGEEQVKLDLDEAGYRTEYFEAVRAVVRDCPRWEILDEAALGVFNFQKLAMWEDLGRNKERITQHPLCRAIADRQYPVPPPPDGLPSERELDERTQPQDTHHILDADSSQHTAIVAVAQGANAVLDGPPGTGKSQTIANIIAESLAAGKTVLFVSEKAAALEVVKRRLDGCGLGDFCLELHSHKANKREVLTELGRCLNVGREPSPRAGNELRQLFDARRELNEYVHELHAVRQPLGMSVYQVHGELARLDRLASRSRCPIPNVHERDAVYLQRMTELLRGLPDCRRVLEDREHHPWRGCKVRVYSLTMQDDAEFHLGRLAAAAAQAAEGAAMLARLGFGAERSSRQDWLASVAQARTVLDTPRIPPAWLQSSPDSAAKAVIGIDGLSKEIRQTRISLSEFSWTALRGLTAPLVDEMRAALSADRTHVTAKTGLTLRERLLDLRRMLDTLRHLRWEAVQLDEAVRSVNAALPAGLQDPKVCGMLPFIELAEIAAGSGPLRASWWDSPTRQELATAIGRAVQEERAAQSQKAALIARLAPEAFAPASAPLVREASRYRAWWKRLWPRWWALKRQLAGWYMEGTPPTAVLLADVQELAGYHRRTDLVRQVREHYADSIVSDSNGQADWNAATRGMSTAVRLERDFKAPAALRALLAPGSSLDRKQLGIAAEALSRLNQSFTKAWEQIGKALDIRGIKDKTSPLPRCTPAELVEWLDARIAACEQQSAVAERLSGLLAEGQDVLWASLLERLDSIRRLIGLREQLAGLREPAAIRETMEEAEERDWTDQAELAQALLSFLAHWNRPLDASVRRGLSDASCRAELAVTAGRNEEINSPAFRESWAFLTNSLFDPAENVSTGLVLNQVPLAELQRWCLDRKADAARIQEWACYRGIEEECQRSGVHSILEEVRSGQVRLEGADSAFRARFLRLWLDRQYEHAPALQQFTTEKRERQIQRFGELDRQSVASAPARVRHRLLGRPGRPTLADDPPEKSELGVLLHEVHKKRRHLPLRTLFARIPTVLPRLKPCLMMSPLAVSTYLQSPDCQFDLIIFDEASQVRPHDAICAVYRGRQIVVAGDQHQLPPTNFFQRSLEGDEDAGEEETANLDDYESLLDVCCSLGLLRRRLRWHYRSRREGLIAFANREVYGNELVTFPSAWDVEDNPAVQFVYVADGRWQTGAGVNPVEARATAELILEHARETPEKSLGVIAFSQRQQMQVLDELETLRRENPELEDFFRADRSDPFFVKNLENVQGDERDAVFLSVGYGPDEKGHVAMRFGPLNREGGQRRLNVAVTRARERMVVISSLRAEDIDLSRTSARGVEMLRSYLDFAERGPVALGAASSQANEHEFDSPFEEEVAEELERRGLTVHRQVGCSGFRIDLAIVDPNAPGRYLLGIECDGEAYHSSATARDRDRLRQQVLTGLGWSVCRIWSADWLRNRGGQVERVLQALERSRRQPLPAPPTHSIARAKETRPPPRPAALPEPVIEGYSSIEKVPDAVIRTQILAALQRYGVTDRDELIQAVSRQLGFKRTGPKIKEAVSEAIGHLLSGGQIAPSAEDNCLRIVSVSPPSST